MKKKLLNLTILILLFFACSEEHEDIKVDENDNENQEMPEGLWLSYDNQRQNIYISVRDSVFLLDVSNTSWLKPLSKFKTSYTVNRLRYYEKSKLLICALAKGGLEVWDISNVNDPVLKTSYQTPASDATSDYQITEVVDAVAYQENIYMACFPFGLRVINFDGELIEEYGVQKARQPVLSNAIAIDEQLNILYLSTRQPAGIFSFKLSSNQTTSLHYQKFNESNNRNRLQIDWNGNRLYTSMEPIAADTTSLLGNIFEPGNLPDLENKIMTAAVKSNNELAPILAVAGDPHGNNIVNLCDINERVQQVELGLAFSKITGSINMPQHISIFPSFKIPGHNAALDMGIGFTYLINSENQLFIFDHNNISRPSLVKEVNLSDLFN